MKPTINISLQKALKEKKVSRHGIGNDSIKYYEFRDFAKDLEKELLLLYDNNVYLYQVLSNSLKEFIKEERLLNFNPKRIKKAIRENKKQIKTKHEQIKFYKKFLKYEET